MGLSLFRGPMSGWIKVNVKPTESCTSPSCFLLPLIGRLGLAFVEGTWQTPLVEHQITDSAPKAPPHPSFNHQKSHPNHQTTREAETPPRVPPPPPPNGPRAPEPTPGAAAGGGAAGLGAAPHRGAAPPGGRQPLGWGGGADSKRAAKNGGAQDPFFFLQFF